MKRTVRDKIFNELWLIFDDARKECMKSFLDQYGKTIHGEDSDIKEIDLHISCNITAYDIDHYMDNKHTSEIRKSYNINKMRHTEGTGEITEKERNYDDDDDFTGMMEDEN